MSFAGRMKTIVVATDLEGQSEAALEYARKLAGAYGARIVLAHGLDPVEYAAVDAVPGNVLNALPETALAALDEMAAELLREGIHSHTEIRQGAVVDMLLDIAKQYEAGLIVVGTRGRRGAGPIAVGSIVEQLVRRATCPVLAVEADWNAGAYRPVPGGPVMLAAEQNSATEAAVDAAQSLAATFTRPLILVHARPAAAAAAFLNPGASSAEEFGIRPAPGVTVRWVVKDGQPADAIQDAIAQFSPSMLVAGVKRKSDSQGRHGTIFSLIAAARVPVLCVPERAGADQDSEQDVAFAGMS